MNIVVPIKLVPDLVEELEIDDAGTDIDREFLSFRINEFCDHAIEEALQLAEAHGGTVTVIAVEREESDKVLYTALAKGVTRAVKITGVDEDLPTRAVASVMCQAIRGMDFDVVLTGVQAPDDLTGQLGVIIASLLDIPHVSVVSGVELSGDKLVIHKEYSGGITARFETTSKVVVGIQAARQTPRYTPVSRVRQIMREAEIEEFAADFSELPATPRVRRMFTPERGEGAEMIPGSTDEVVDRISTLLNEKRS